MCRSRVRAGFPARATAPRRARAPSRPPSTPSRLPPATSCPSSSVLFGRRPRGPAPAGDATRNRRAGSPAAAGDFTFFYCCCATGRARCPVRAPGLAARRGRPARRLSRRRRAGLPALRGCAGRWRCAGALGGDRIDRQGPRRGRPPPKIGGAVFPLLRALVGACYALAPGPGFWRPGSDRASSGPYPGRSRRPRFWVAPPGSACYACAFSLERGRAKDHMRRTSDRGAA